MTVWARELAETRQRDVWGCVRRTGASTWLYQGVPSGGSGRPRETSDSPHNSHHIGEARLGAPSHSPAEALRWPPAAASHGTGPAHVQASWQQNLELHRSTRLLPHFLWVWAVCVFICSLITSFRRQMCSQCLCQHFEPDVLWNLYFFWILERWYGAYMVIYLISLMESILFLFLQWKMTFTLNGINGQHSLKSDQVRFAIKWACTTFRKQKK